MNIAIFCSGRGTNLQAIIDAVREGKIKARIRLVIGDVKDAYCLTRARKADIRTIFIDPEKFKTREAYDKEIIKYLKEERIDLVILAGFMKILSSYFIKKYRNKILNIHPALLPAFKGTQGIKDAWQYGVKVTGVTVHFVTKILDSGPIILQKAVRVKEDDTMESLEEKIHKVEHKLYPEAIKFFCENRLKIIGRKVKIISIVFMLLFPSLGIMRGVFAEDAKIRNYYCYLPTKLSIGKNIKLSSVGYKKSESESFIPAACDGPKDSWKPLTKQEYQKESEELVYSSAKATAEFFDSIYMPYISRGLFNIIGTAYRIDKYKQDIKKKHGVGLGYKPGKKEVYLFYKRKY